MQAKPILAAACAALAAPLPALADSDNVTIYGKINLALESVKASGATSGSDIPRMMRVTSNLSYLGFRGEEDLGDGLAAIWQVEQDINPDAGAAGFANRNTFVGLKGGWGRVLGGRYDMYWTSHIAGIDSRLISTGIAGSILSVFGSYGNYNPGAAAAGTVGSAATTPLSGGRAANVVRYESPSIGGLSGTATLSLGEAKSSTANPYGWQLEAHYRKGPLIANLAHLQAHDSNGLFHNGITAMPGVNARATKLVVGNTFSSGTFVGVAGEALATSYPNGDVKRNAFALHLGQQLSPAVYLGTSYGRASKVSTTIPGAASTDGTGADFLALIGTLALSKRTMLYAEYAAIHNGANARYGFVSTASLNNGSRTAGPGADPSTILVGINHMF